MEPRRGEGGHVLESVSSLKLKLFQPRMRLGSFPGSLTGAVHHGNANRVGTSHHKATIVHHLVMEPLVPVSCGSKEMKQGRLTAGQTSLLYLTHLI